MCVPIVSLPLAGSLSRSAVGRAPYGQRTGIRARADLASAPPSISSFDIEKGEGSLPVRTLVRRQADACAIFFLRTNVRAIVRPGARLCAWIKAVLRDVGLVRDRRAGREKFYRLNAGPLRDVSAWVFHYEQFWRGKLEALGEHLKRST